MAAAVADFRPVAAEDGKIKKSEHERLELVLEPTTDVLSGLASARRPGQTLIGFAAEHGEQALERAREKLAAKGIDGVIVNDISREDIGFDADVNEVTILSAPGDRSRIVALHVPRASKAEVAGAILDAALRLRASG
jgi:phosphopantothenoylcysteine decarboxylase/phosphopantothenate--cysteine ligase